MPRGRPERQAGGPPPARFGWGGGRRGASFRARPSLRSGCLVGVRCRAKVSPLCMRAEEERSLATNVLLAWVGFVCVVLGLLAVDLGVFNRRAHVITMREAARWSLVTMVLAGIFAFLIWPPDLPTDIA